MAKPKLIEKWVDKVENITNSIYQYSNGVRLVLSENPATIDFDISVIAQGGSYFEKQLGKPQGTSHFLEHILAGNPNAKFKTREEMDRFRFGDKNRPGLGYNASTTKRYLYFYMHGNEAGAERMAEYVYYMVHYPLEKISDFIDKERKIIMAEYQRMKKEENDAALTADKYILSKSHADFVGRIIGTADSIEAISTQDLVDFYEAVFRGDNITISVQVREKPKGELSSWIEKLATAFAAGPKELKLKTGELVNKFEYEVFHDAQRQGIFMSVFHFKPYSAVYNYREMALDHLYGELISKYCFDYLREEKGLVYGVDDFKAGITWDWDEIGYKLTCEAKNFPQILDECVGILPRALEFAKTKQGKHWFEGQISRYIFKRTVQFDSDYAEGLATGVLRGKYRYDYKKAEQAARKITVGDLVAYIEETYLNLEPHIWVESPTSREEMLELISQSNFAKQYTATHA